ncbi:MAG: sulfite exporter TauE/SafE family protein [Oscillospiraceae bacterium]|nr:sulfite exporter TauE/SafE family protein [Oscillospiraceae bacterium]
MGQISRSLFFFVILFLANVIQAITGFAGTLLAMPFSIRLLGAEEAKTLLNFFTMLACLGVAVQGRRHIRWGELGKILLGMSLGMAAGIWAYRAFPLGILLKGYGLLIIAVTVRNMVRPGGARMPAPVMWLVLFLAGVIHGMFVSGGALLVIYAAVKLPDKDEFRATVASVWVALNGFLAFSYGWEGSYTPQTLWTLALGLVPLALALWTGARLYSKVDQIRFTKLNNILLLLSGASALF